MKIRFISYKVQLFFNIIAVNFDIFLPTCNKFCHSVNEEFEKFCGSSFDKGRHCCLDVIVWLETNTLKCLLQFWIEMEVQRRQIWTWNSLQPHMDMKSCTRGAWSSVVVLQQYCLGRISKLTYASSQTLHQTILMSRYTIWIFLGIVFSAVKNSIIACVLNLVDTALVFNLARSKRYYL